LKDLAIPTYSHFFMPVNLYPSFTDGSIDEPAQVAGLKFPCRAICLALSSTLFYVPARLTPFTEPLSKVYQKKGLSLHVARHPSPSLLVTADSFGRGPEQLGHLLLCPIQALSDAYQFFTVHG
jgi:hypothetical protein